MRSAPYIAIILIFSGILMPGTYLLFGLPIVLLFVTLYDAGALGIFVHRKFWLWILLGTVILPLLGGEGKVEIWGIGYSLHTLFITSVVAGRGIFIVIGMSLIRRHIEPSVFADVLRKLGFSGISVFIPISFNLVPLLMENSLRTISIWRLRGGLRKNRVKNILILLVSLQVQWVREAENLSMVLHQEEMMIRETVKDVSLR